jgi:prephenate dehydratase
MKTIAYQGIKGAFSYLTAINVFGDDHHFKGLESFTAVFTSVACGKADYGVIPIENSLVGSIYESYDLMNISDVQIVGEQFTKIEHCLLTVSNGCESSEEQIKGIRKVMSHPKALQQCNHFFQEHPWIEAVAYNNTAAAAAEVASMRNPEWAAIASENAGKRYGLQILSKGIEDDPQNYTRFVIVSKNEARRVEGDKCSLLIQLNHTPGTLSTILKEFSDEGANLTKIESRPILGSPFEYVFYVDFEFSELMRHKFESLLEKVCQRVLKLKILGFYKRGSLWKC